MLNTAVVGLGNVAAWHRRAIERTAGVTLTAVADVDESVAQDRATQWGVTPYTDLETLLATEQTEWVHVCTPDRKSTRLNSSHITRSRMPSSA